MSKSIFNTVSEEANFLLFYDIDWKNTKIHVHFVRIHHVNVIDRCTLSKKIHFIHRAILIIVKWKTFNDWDYKVWTFFWQTTNDVCKSTFCLFWISDDINVVNVVIHVIRNWFTDWQVKQQNNMPNKSWKKKIWMTDIARTKNDTHSEKM